MSKLNWSTAKLVPKANPTPEQVYYQQRYGDELTKAIKVAKHNSRKERCGGETPAER